MLELKLLDDKEFLNIYYRKKPILQDELDTFLKALKDYRADLYKNINENEDALIANALAPFFQKLGFKTQVKSKQTGKSEVDLALLRNDNNSPINAIWGGGYKNLEILIEAKKPDSKEFLTPLKTPLQSLKKELAKLNNHAFMLPSSLRGSSEATSKQSITNTNVMDCHKGANAPSRNDMGRDFKTPFHTPLDSKNPNAPEDIPPTFSPHCKALYEAILYYFRERKAGNSSLKFIIITDFYRFFIFRSIEFERLFYDNKEFQKFYTNFTDKNSLFKGNTSEFYAECERILKSQNYENSIPKKDLFDNVALKGFYIELKTLFSKDFSDKDFKILKPIFKTFSPEFLLNTFNPNDANTLNKDFYNELLYILGLGEFKQNGKIIIAASKESKAGHFTLYNAILQKCKDKDIFKAKNEDERFESLMQLIILWLNRILFLKLIEASLVKFNNDKNLKFLNIHKVPSFSILSGLFFEILAKNSHQRDATHLKALYYLPYLNSSLFEKQELENTLLDIKDLENADFEYFKLTQIKDKNAKKKQGKIKLLDYIFEFLDSFDFGSDEEDGEFIEQKNDLISSSVLGLVFEKLNGYKEGSFYTPSFITSYMCKQSLQKVVIGKFNEAKSWECKDINELKIKLDKLTDLNGGYKEANAIFHSIKICDPSVGSGHFLVSALNELIFLKFDLGILCEIDSQECYYRLKDIRLEVYNDEIIITDSKGAIFSYTLPAHENIESHRIQKALFETKKALIESCLFGVDINPNSCEITKLRLWIELLKHSYYKNIANKELETLPNIDINIKCGNSLISNFELWEVDKNQKAKKGSLRYLCENDREFANNIKQKIKDYKSKINAYKNNLGIKENLRKDIDNIKEFFRKRLIEISDEMELFKANIESYIKNFGDSDFDIESNFGFEVVKIKRKNSYAYEVSMTGLDDEFIQNPDKEKLYNALLQSYNDLQDLRQKESFEWRFEFPEVLDNNGNFLGFDLIIGNPPYIKEADNKKLFESTKNLRTYQGKMDIWYHFVGKGFDIVKNKGIVSFIATNNWTTNAGAKNLRNVILKESQILNLIDFGAYMVFENADIQTMIMEFQKCNSIPKNYTFNYAKIEAKKPTHLHREAILKRESFEDNCYLEPSITPSQMQDKTLTFANSKQEEVLNKILKKGTFYLQENEAQIGIGLTDKVKKKMGLIDCEVGTGIFQLTTKEVEALNLSQDELKFIKPLYTTEELCRFYGNPKNNEWVIYTDSSFKNPNSMDNYPNLKKHLDKFANVITSDNKPYGLHRAKQEHFFNQTPSIISLRKCPDIPSFTYVDFDCYVTSTFFIIQTHRIDLKFLTGLLNSKLIAFWLKHKGKMQGNNYQIDKEPLMAIPLIEITAKNQKIADEITALVEQILTHKAKDKNFNTLELEKQIDKLVYALYSLTNDEIHIIEEK